MSRLFDRLTVAGVGLVGGSLAGAVRAAGLAGEVVGFGRQEANLRLAAERGLVDRVTRDPEEAVRDADAIVLAAPLAACPGLADRFRSHARRGTLLTDVGSVKAGVVAALERAWAGVGPMVGAHPIAGGEDAGAGAARPDLFGGHVCILTPNAGTDRAALARVRALWEGIGARVEEMDAERHDALLARVSHLPHLVAYALVAAVAEARDPLPYAGPGFRDTTRIAASPPGLWADIILSNAAAVTDALGEFRAVLGRMESAIAAHDAEALERVLAGAQAVRRGLGEKE